MPINEAKLNEFLQKIVGDAATAASAALVLLGDRLGLYKTLAEAGPLTSQQLAERTGTRERYVREWLSAQAASGYVNYDPATAAFAMTPEQAALLANPDHPFFLASVFYSIASLFKDESIVSDAFRSGRGVGWHEHSDCLFCGTERFFGRVYQNFLIDVWIPSLDGIKEKLERGATVADVGCGHGVSTLLMARAFPRSTFVGFDYHESSIRRAREMAAESGLQNVEFRVSDARQFPGTGYGLVTFFDCLHDMGDPVGAARHVRQALAADGAWMIVEPLAGDRLEDNLHPVGRLFYSFSTLVCTPASLSQDVGLGLGAQAGDARLREVVTAGGLTRFRRVSATPTHVVLEARP
jgi:2-polyprenyl-3-methyl-5-hydroxy-6-metoxy-1,4-benzoquinol methylase